MSDLSTRVRLRREQLGLSQEELARRMGYRSRSSITKGWKKMGINDLPPVQSGGAGAGAGDHLPPLCWGWTRPAPVPRALSRCPPWCRCR